MLNLFNGLKWSIFPNKSRATGLDFGKRVDHACLFLFGRDFTYLTARSFPMNSSSSLVGVPRIPTTRLI